MSRRFVGNRRELLSALGGAASATTKRPATAARRVRGIVCKDGINGRRNTVVDDAADAAAAAAATVVNAAAAPVRKRQRLAKARAMPSTTTASMTNPRPTMVMMKTMLATTRKSRDLNFPARGYATEQAPQPQPQPPPSSSLPPQHSLHANGPYDPNIELKHYTGSRAYLEIQAVLQGQISLETARVHRLHNLMALLNNVDQVKRQLRDEDMAGDPAALDARMAAFLAERERTVELWRREAQARQERQRQQQLLLQYNDSDTAMVHPAHVPGRRMGPAENEQQRQELDRLVQAQTAVFEVRPLPLGGQRVVAAAAGARAGPGSFGATPQQQQIRLFSTRTTPAQVLPPLITTIRQRAFFWTTAASAFHSSHGRRTTATATTTTTTNTTTDQVVSKPKAKSKPKPQPQSTSTSKSKSKSKSKPRQPPPSPTHNPNKPNPDSTPTPTPPAWAIQKQALAAKFGSEGWSPRRKLSPDAMLHLRALHTANPQLYTTQLLASTFKQSPEAIRRILKSKWLSERASPEAVQARRDRWARRHDRIWDVKSELGLRPKRTRDRRVEDASQGAERVEDDLWAEAVLKKARDDSDGQGV